KQLRDELELLVAATRLKEDKKDLEVFNAIGDEKFFEEVKRGCEELDKMESENEKVSKIKLLLQSCEQKKLSLGEDKEDLRKSIDEFIKNLNEEVKEVGESSKEKGDESQNKKELGTGDQENVDGLISQNLSTLTRIITKVNNLDVNESLKIFEFAPPSEPKKAGMEMGSDVKKKIKSAILKLKSSDGGIEINEVFTKGLISNLGIKENKSLIITLYKEISESLKTKKLPTQQLMLKENFVLSDSNKRRMVVMKMSEFIRTLMACKNNLMELGDMGQDIKVFLNSFQKIVSKINKSLPKSIKATLYDILGVDTKASQENIKMAFRKKSMTMHPDKGGDKDKFIQLKNAYDILSNEESRKKYDRENNI
ncbi:J domain-containing protein, partial [bacterium]|nr:J domain-containing protein [bacterium]